MDQKIGKGCLLAATGDSTEGLCTTKFSTKNRESDFYYNSVRIKLKPHPIKNNELN